MKISFLCITSYRNPHISGSFNKWDFRSVKRLGHGCLFHESFNVQPSNSPIVEYKYCVKFWNVTHEPGDNRILDISVSPTAYDIFQHPPCPSDFLICIGDLLLNKERVSSDETIRRDIIGLLNAYQTRSHMTHCSQYSKGVQWSAQQLLHNHLYDVLLILCSHFPNFIHTLGHTEIKHILHHYDLSTYTGPSEGIYLLFQQISRSGVSVYAFTLLRRFSSTRSLPSSLSEHRNLSFLQQLASSLNNDREILTILRSDVFPKLLIDPLAGKCISLLKRAYLGLKLGECFLNEVLNRIGSQPDMLARLYVLNFSPNFLRNLSAFNSYILPVIRENPMLMSFFSHHLSAHDTFFTFLLNETSIDLLMTCLPSLVEFVVLPEFFVDRVSELLLKSLEVNKASVLQRLYSNFPVIFSGWSRYPKFFKLFQSRLPNKINSLHDLMDPFLKHVFAVLEFDSSFRVDAVVARYTDLHKSSESTVTIGELLDVLSTSKQVDVLIDNIPPVMAHRFDSERFRTRIIRFLEKVFTLKSRLESYILLASSLKNSKEETRLSTLLNDLPMHLVSIVNSDLLLNHHSISVSLLIAFLMELDEICSLTMLIFWNKCFLQHCSFILLNKTVSIVLPVMNSIQRLKRLEALFLSFSKNWTLILLYLLFQCGTY
ncbi:hypothetical protein GEMRC1_004669 [Eukaryota sp. GEM-RC1]